MYVKNKTTLFYTPQIKPQRIRAESEYCFHDRSLGGTFLCVLPSWPYIPLRDPKMSKQSYESKACYLCFPPPTNKTKAWHSAACHITVLVVTGLTALCNAWCEGMFINIDTDIG